MTAQRNVLASGLQEAEANRVRLSRIAALSSTSTTTSRLESALTRVDG